MKKVNYTENRRVLTVDDVEVHLVMMRSFLHKVNPFMPIEQATTVADAIARPNDGPFDAVISGWNLPGDRWKESAQVNMFACQLQPGAIRHGVSQYRQTGHHSRLHGAGGRRLSHQAVQGARFVSKAGGRL